MEGSRSIYERWASGRLTQQANTWWGDEIGPKASETIRAIFLNANGIPAFNSHYKNASLFAAISILEPDMIGLSEVNAHWLNVPEDHRLHCRYAGWFRDGVHISLSYNTTRPVIGQHNYGGVCLLSIDQARARAKTKGQDPTGLGRWSWTTTTGKGTILLRTVTVYCPHDTGGPESVYAQHRHYLNNQDDERTPREAFWEDLCKEVAVWYAAGNQIIIGGDFNQDTATIDQLQKFNMRDALRQRHDGSTSENRPTPATYNRGSTTLDAIFVTPSLVCTHCGYLEYGQFTPSDHRAPWIDITYQVAYGNKIPEIVRAHARRLKCDDPRIVNKFNGDYAKYLKQHKLGEKVQQLRQQLSGELTKEQQLEYERIDKKRSEGAPYAESRCRKLKMGQVPFSDKLQAASAIVDARRLQLTKLHGGKVSSRFLQRTFQAAGVEYKRDISLQEGIAAKKEAINSYIKVKKKGPELRRTFQENLAQARAEAGNTSAAKELIQLQTREQQRLNWFNIKRVTGKLQGGGVTFVTELQPNGTYKPLREKIEIEQAFMKANEAKYRQSYDTDFLTEPMLSEFGYLGLTENAAKVMDGTYEVPATAGPYVQKLLDHLKMNDNAKEAPEAPTTLDVATWQKLWSKAKERTASHGPMHFGIFKAGSKNEFIALFDSTMTEIPMITGYSPERWRQVTDAMLVKKKGIFEVDKMRTIVLFTPDFNALNKLLGRTMMWTAEDCKQLAPEQYGSRKRHRSVDQGSNKRMSADMMLMLRRPGVICSNDAKSCYDRIVHAVAALCMLRQRVPESAITCVFTTLQNLSHTIRTAYGDSTSTYGGSYWIVPATNEAGPMHGIMQGNGKGPALWAVISSPVLAMLRADGYGTVFKLAISGDELHYVGFSFVDDMDQIETARTIDETAHDVVSQMQGGIDCWNGGVKVTGGALVPIKSYWYLVDFIWENGQWRVAEIADSPEHELFVTDCNGERHLLARLELSKAKETLGIWFAPSGSAVDQVKEMRKLTENWADQFRTGKLSRPEAWLALTTTIWKTLEYPLNALTLTKEECEYVMAPAISSGLNGAGICRNLPKALRHGPTSYQGLELPHIYTIQGIARLTDLLNHNHIDTNTGFLHRASLEQMIVNAGLGPDLLEYSHKKYGQLATFSLMEQNWKFLSDNKIVLLHDIKMPTRREGDDFLMKIFVNHALTKPTLLAAQRCMQYLQVSTVSDITNGDGSRVSDNALAGNYDSQRPHYYQWPYQQKPPTADWTIWRRILRQCLHDEKLSLNHRIGHWTDQSECNWLWFFSPIEERLFQRSATGWKLWIPNSRRQLRSINRPFKLAGSVEVLPTVHRATVQPHGLLVRMTGYTSEVPTTNPMIHCFQDYVDSQPHTRIWCVQQLTIDGDGSALAQAIKNNEAVMVSDGSFKDARGTAAIVLQGPNADGEARAVNRVPGEPEDHDSYRSEVSGLLGIATLIELLCEFFDIQQGSVEVACDGLSALNEVFDLRRRVSTKTPHFDLVVATRRIIQRSNQLTWFYRHVSSHQDDLRELEDLNRWETLNVEVDDAAKIHLREDYDKPNPRIIIQDTPWMVSIDNRKLVRNIKDQLYTHVHLPALKAYWIKKDRFTDDNFDTVDWQATAKAMHSFPITKRHHVVKHTSGWCSVGKMAKRWNLRPTDHCPRCGEQETTRHVWRCRSPEAVQVWQKSVAALARELGRLQTAPAIIDAIKSRLLAWKSYDVLPTYQTTFPGLSEAIANQDDMGWDNFLEGTIVKNWQSIQATYYHFLQSRKTTLRWASALIRKSWEVAWDQWEHRNGILHDKDNAVSFEEIERITLNIRQEFATGRCQLPKGDAYLFRGTVDKLLRKKVHQLQNWLEQVEAARARQHRRIQTTWPPERILLLRWLRGQTWTPLDNGVSATPLN